MVRSEGSVVCAYVFETGGIYTDTKTPHIYVRKLHDERLSANKWGSLDSHWSDPVRVRFPDNFGIITNNQQENSFIKLGYSESQQKFFVCVNAWYDTGQKGQWVGTFDNPFVCNVWTTEEDELVLSPG